MTSTSGLQYRYAVLFLTITIQVCAIENSKAFDIEHHIRKRSLREDGYDNFQLATVRFTYKQDDTLHSFTNSRHVRDTKHPGAPVELSIEGSDTHFKMLLQHAKPVMSKNVQVVVVSKDNKANADIIDQEDCLMSGSLKSHPETTAVISYCNGLIGGFSIDSYHYFIETTDDGDEETILLARKEVKASCDGSEQQLPKTFISPPGANVGNRRKRSLGSLVVEAIVVLDEDYVALLHAAGHDTDQSIYDYMRLKWTGIQAEWAKVDVLEYDVKFEVKKIEIWETNEFWFDPFTDLDTALLMICSKSNDQGLWKEYDHIHLFTGVTGTLVSGKAYTGKICKDGFKCAVSTYESIAEYYIPAHEVGHCLGMAHDGDISNTCTPGIMGSSYIGWSNCSVNSFKALVASLSPNCLLTTDVTDSEMFSLEALWPGMVYTDDEVCELQHGPGFVYKGSANSCGGYSCINLDPNSEKYGVSFRNSVPTVGRYCGEDMVCSTDNANYQCISVSDTGLNSSLINKVSGGWSEWGTMTSCSRTCGTGVQYRQRTCDNPKPQSTAGCDGDEYDAQVCNTQACSGDSLDENELITQRAGETCTSWKSNDMYRFINKDAANYLNTGSKQGSSDDNQCDVKCDTVENYSAQNSERHGMMPDGTPCTLSSLSSSFVENNDLPRKSGMYGTCVQSHCYQFGCDDKSGSTRIDGCGVCGGDNSTCQIFDDIYGTVLAPKDRGLMVRLPANASLIQFYFTYSGMSNHFIELKMKDKGSSEFGTNVINFQALDTRDNPISFAGTYWYLLSTKAYLYAQGPINQAADVVLYNYNSGYTKNNTGVIYAYSLPLASDMANCNGICENGGTWNSSTCSCDCPDGYYGISCETTCNKYCKNSQSLSTSGCSCNCQGNTYGSKCNCKYPFTGIDCLDCKITSCQNGGTFDATACRCLCPEGFGELDCSTPCEDVSDTADCEVKVGKGHCVSKNEDMEANCYKSCGLCNATTTTTSTTSTTTTTTSTTSSTTTSTTTPTTSTTTTVSQTSTSAVAGSTAEDCTHSNTNDCNNGAGSLLLSWTHELIPIPDTSLIYWSPWLLLLQTVLLNVLLL